MAASLTMRQQINAMIDMPYALTQLAEGYVLQGNPDLARRTLEEALEIRERNDDAWFEAEIYRLLGDVTIAESGDVAAAEAFFRKSLEVAVDQGTRSFELRTAVRLARLLGNTDRVAEAVEILEPVRRWFDGQSETVDSRAADEMLAALSK